MFQAYLYCVSIILNIEAAKHYAYEHNALKIVHFLIQLYKYEKPAFDYQIIIMLLPVLFGVSISLFATHVHAPI